ncbi:hypothetical protein L1887_02121 [Cichorium endivia]|nr:hypothetical protein L1887_02121 [Cichorium endivia]
MNEEQRSMLLQSASRFPPPKGTTLSYSIKVADPSGGMLTQDWEPFADSIANAPDPESLVQLTTEFAKKENIPLDGANKAAILLGRDTRPSGESLVEAAKQVRYYKNEV